MAAPHHPHPGGHAWIAASNVPLDDKQAKYAERRGALWVGCVPDPEGHLGVKIEALEVSCGACRRPYADVAGLPCAALASTEHLRGGPIGERKKRPRPAVDPAAPPPEITPAPPVGALVGVR